MKRRDIVPAIKMAINTHRLPVFLCRTGAGDVSTLSEELTDAYLYPVRIDCARITGGNLTSDAKDAITDAKKHRDKQYVLLFENIDKALPEVAENIMLLAKRHVDGMGLMPENIHIVIAIKSKSWYDYDVERAIQRRCMLYKF